MRSLLIAIALLLTAAPAAGAGSIAYVDGGDVWLSSLDGQQKVRLATPAGNAVGNKAPRRTPGAPLTPVPLDIGARARRVVAVDMGSLSVGTAGRATQEGALMIPASSSRTWSRDVAAPGIAPRFATHASQQAGPAAVRSPSPHAFEVRCTDIHPLSCEETLRAGRPSDVVELAREHGARVHGFTPVWYSPERLEGIAAAVTRWP